MKKKKITVEPDCTQVSYENDLIECPSCKLINKARILHTVPFPTYIHRCYNCDHVIMESEWRSVSAERQNVH